MQMTFYQELQLSSVGSKQLIKNTTDPKEKRRHILIYNFKVYLVMAFCIATGRFRYPDNARTHFYRRNICNSYGGTKAGQYASTSGCLCGEYCLYHASYGAWLS